MAVLASPERHPVPTGFRQPAEWAPHRAVWVAWPCAAELWLENLEPAQQAVARLCHALADVDPASGRPRGERLEVLCANEVAVREVRSVLCGLEARVHRIPYGDIWLRDTGPVFVAGPDGAVAPVRFGFNGWGGKFDLPHDGDVAACVALASGRRGYAYPDFVFEGGSVDVDGEGTALTTRQCLLNPNRNPGMTEARVEARLREALGVERVVWLEEGLRNDHTDGHVDNLARFVAPGVVAVPEAEDADDPNRALYAEVARTLAQATDARGRRLRVVRLPSPGRVVDAEGRVVPASYANFYVGNRAVVVPTYDAPRDAAAVEVLAGLFPGRRAVGVPSRAVLSGGGAFHCITQQEPAGSAS